MAKRSAGTLLYRLDGGRIEILLVHLGGPFWRGRHFGAWQIPKGLVDAGESALCAALRETEEELGIRLTGTPTPLATIRQAGGKVVEAFALEQDLDARAIKSNVFELEWPAGSGRLQSFPEIDGAQWLSLEAAERVMLESQKPLLGALREHVGRRT